MRSLLNRERAALIVVDVQEKLFPLVERSCEMMKRIEILVRTFKALGLPIFLSEQYPQGLGETIGSLKELALGAACYQKTTFSCASDSRFAQEIRALGKQEIILAGIEAHVCILQTAVLLKEQGYEVTVANDAISSRSIFDYSTAIADMRDFGIRITSTESVLFELLRDSKAKEFKEISKLIR